MKIIIIFLLMSTCLVSCIQTSPEPISTKTPELEKWMTYERALAFEILESSDAQCEWEIIGQSNQKVYVWAACLTTTAEADSKVAASVNAVIYLGQFGSIEKIEEISDVEDESIPPEIQKKMLEQSKTDIDAMWAHLFSRQENLEPLLIVLSGTPLP